MAFQESIGLPYTMADVPWKTIMTWFAIGGWAYESILMLRQYRVMQRPAPAVALSENFSQQDIQTAKAYNSAMSKSNLLHHLWELAFAAALIRTRLLANLWAISGAITRLYHPRDDVAQSILFYTAILILVGILYLPQQIYTDFFLSQRYNIGKTRPSVGAFTFNIVAGVIMNALFAAAAITIALRVLQITGDNFAYYSWLLFASTKLSWTIFGNVAPPRLFAKFSPLEQGNLRTEIENLAERENFTFKEIYVMHNVRNSPILRVWIYGMPWRRSFVLGDDLLREVSSREVAALIAHEMGHCKFGHRYTSLVLSQLYLAIRVYLFCNVFIDNPSFYAAFDFPTSQPKVVGLVLYVFTLGPIRTAFELLDKIWCRRMESQADRFAMDRSYGQDLASCLIKLTKTILSVVEVDWLYAICKLNEPHLLERIRALGWTGPREEKGESD